MRVIAVNDGSLLRNGSTCLIQRPRLGLAGRPFTSWRHRRPVFGLVALASAVASGDFLAALMKGSRIGEIVRESLTIGGWVSMWRPLEIFLYDWWPIRSESRLSERLAAMPVRIRYANATAPDAWREDWPAVSPRGERATSEAQPRPLNQAS